MGCSNYFTLRKRRQQNFIHSYLNFGIRSYLEVNHNICARSTFVKRVKLKERSQGHLNIKWENLTSTPGVVLRFGMSHPKRILTR